MKFALPFHHIAASVIFLSLCRFLSAQELTFMGGSLSTPDLEQGSYTWQLDYRHGLYKNLEASISWINEGHVVGHHRDGNALELWYRLPFHENLFRLSVGAGPYYYYDTRPLPNGDSENVHGTAVILSVSAEGEIHDRFFWRLTANRIEANTDLKTNGLLFGVGYWLGDEDHLPKGNMPGIFEPGAPFPEQETKNEFAIFGGWSVVNTLFSEGARSFAAEYRRELTPHLDLSMSYLYEGDPKVVRRSGAAVQVWPVGKSFGGKFEVGFGVGTYVYIDRRHVQDTSQKRQAALAGIVSPMVTYRFSDSVFTRIIWNRVITNYNRDSDIWLVGIGCKI